MNNRAMGLLIELGPAILAGVAGYLLQAGLRDAKEPKWWLALASLLPLTLLGVLLWAIARLGGLGGVLALFCAITVTVVAVSMGLWMLITLSGKYKLAALLIGVLTPVAIFSIIFWADTMSPETVTQKNGNQIIAALEEYHADTGAYPERLRVLVPKHLESLPDALTTQGTGWLFVSNGDRFTLGYWFYPDKFGVILCKFGTGYTEWNCGSTHIDQVWEPFEPVYTPMPGSYLTPVSLP